MAERKPLVLVGTEIQELPAGDSMPAANIPEVTAAHIHAATSKATPVDADELGIVDSADSWVLKKITWANLKAALAGVFFSKSGGDIAGNIDFTGSGRRIRFPFIGTPVGNRTLFQSSDANASTYIGVIPNGTDRSAGITFSNSSDPDNAGYGFISMTDVEMLITSGIAIGTGGTGGLPGAVPLVLRGNGGAALRLSNGVVGVTSGVLGYGVGSGGTATQPTSNTAPVTLNKPSGQITMSGPMAAGANAVFSVNNSYVTQQSVIALTLGAGMVGAYSVEVDAQPGYFRLYVRNVLGATTSTPAVINFAVIAGSAT